MNMLIVLGILLLFVIIMTIIFYIQKPWLDKPSTRTTTN
jgi:hypothetical protein